MVPAPVNTWGEKSQQSHSQMKTAHTEKTSLWPAGPWAGNLNVFAAKEQGEQRQLIPKAHGLF